MSVKIVVYGSSVLVGAALTLGGAGVSAAPPAPNPERNAYYGETHLHTSWSFDAFIFGDTKSTPGDAYDYAKGKPLKHALGFEMKIKQPLDWMGVTDHSEYVGVIQQANTPGTPLSQTELGKKLIVRDAADVQRIYLFLGGTMIENKPIAELVAPALASSVWDKNNAYADAANEPGKFTAFNSYEWTSTPDNANLHRNIFFRDGKKLPKMPFSSFDSQAPEDLWAWMDKQREQGIELLAISHNANVSDGLMYPSEVDFKGRPIDRAWADARMRNERLIEIKQIKGQSETHPLLSPTDEFANYEIMSYLLGDPQGKFPRIPGSYLRDALRNGIAMQDTKGYNPYKPGIVAGSDSHNGAAPYRQDNYFGGHARADGGLKERMAGHIFAGGDIRLMNPAGLSAIWAEENTRASLFDGMQRKETFATSGVRIKLRFFGGWGFGKGAGDGKDWVKKAYAAGVPMGGDLPEAKAKAPSFIVWAVKDPTSGNLDRVQIVKGWTKNGQSFEKVHDVVWAGDRKPDITGKLPAIGSTVDLRNATYKNTIGKTELKTVWTDPDFDPALDAFYYARVLEIPTPRWTTIQAKELGIELPANVPATVEERAWSSPIWYTPTAQAKSGRTEGVTVAALKQQGAAALDDAALSELLVGKNVWLKNTVTGGVFRIVWSKDGQRVFWNINPRSPQPQHFSFAAQDSYQGLSIAYAIKNGKVVESFGNTPLEWTAYKQGDRTLLARSDEFGFANYEVVPVPQALVDLEKVKR